MTKLVFSINSGRSGSDYLYQLLATAKNAAAFHEPRPSMAGSRMSQVPANRFSLRTTALQLMLYPKKYAKVREIRKVISQLPTGYVYCETNHMFILTFYDVIMRHFDDVACVVLRRYMPWVVKSFLDLGMFVDGNSMTKYWTSSPNSPSAAVKAPALDCEMDHVDRCIGYVIDIEARVQRFRRQYPKCQIIEKRLYELNEPHHVQDLFDQLSLISTEKTWHVMGQVCNHKRADKPSDYSEAYCLERIMRYLNLCKEQGIELPELPHLAPCFAGQSYAEVNQRIGDPEAR